MASGCNAVRHALLTAVWVCLLGSLSGCGGGGGTSASLAGADGGTGTNAIIATTTAATTTTTLPAAYSAGTVATWENALVFIPGETTGMRLRDIPKDQTYPVMIFMHGCAGLDSQEHANWGRLLASLGVLVVMPDSFARPGRPVNCDHLMDNGGAYPEVHQMRLDEIDYASRQIRTQAWHDGKPLLLMGFSEGAIAAVRTTLGGFRGVIATSWTCTHRSMPALQGIYLPLDLPLLTIRHEEDDWFVDASLDGNCATYMASRPDASSLVVPGFGHETFHDASAREAVSAFVQRLLETP